VAAWLGEAEVMPPPDGFCCRSEFMDNPTRKHRERLQWTQWQLAQAAEVSRSTVQRLESGKKVAAEQMQAIAGTLKVGVEDLNAGMPALILATVNAMFESPLTPPDLRALPVPVATILTNFCRSSRVLEQARAAMNESTSELRQMLEAPHRVDELIERCRANSLAADAAFSDWLQDAFALNTLIARLG